MEIEEGVILWELHDSSDDTKAESNNCELLKNWELTY